MNKIMEQKKLNTLNRESQAIDILKDSDFLRLFRNFIVTFGKEYIENENISGLLEDFSRKDYLSYFQKKNNNNLFKQFFAFFSDKLDKSIFFESIRGFNIDEKKLNLFLNIGEYLEEIGDKSMDYDNSIYSLSSEYKKSIGEVIVSRNISNSNSLLLKNGYPLLSPSGYVIIECNFKESIAYNTLSGKNLYVWCRDEINNIFYQNKQGDILMDKQSKMIKYIDTKSMKTFGDYRLYNFVNEDNQKRIMTEDILFGIEQDEIIGEGFNTKEIGYLDEYFDEEGNYFEEENIFEYLHINRKQGDILLNKDFQEVSVLDILNFLNENNPFLLDSVAKDLSRLGKVGVSDIHSISCFDGVRFVEMDCNIDMSLGHKKEEIIPELKHVVFINNGRPLIDTNMSGDVYIRSLGDSEVFLDKIFVSYSLTGIGGIDGYIDSYGNVVNITDKKLVSIDLLSEMNGKKVYIINKKPGKRKQDDLILTEKELESELSKYKGFEDIGTEFEICPKLGKSIKIGNNYFDKIIGIVKHSNDVIFYLEKKSKRIKVDYNFLLNNLKETDFGRDALKKIAKTITVFEKT